MCFVSSDFLREVSLEPTCTITRFMEGGRERSSVGSSSNITGTVDPGKQCVAALKKRTFLIIESPTISVVGEKSGRGVVNRWFPFPGRAESEPALREEDVECGRTGLATGTAAGA